METKENGTISSEEKEYAENDSAHAAKDCNDSVMQFSLASLKTVTDLKQELSACNSTDTSDQIAGPEIIDFLHYGHDGKTQCLPSGMPTCHKVESYVAPFGGIVISQCLCRKYQELKKCTCSDISGENCTGIRHEKPKEMLESGHKEKKSVVEKVEDTNKQLKDNLEIACGGRDILERKCDNGLLHRDCNDMAVSDMPECVDLVHNSYSDILLQPSNMNLRTFHLKQKYGKFETTSNFQDVSEISKTVHSLCMCKNFDKSSGECAAKNETNVVQCIPDAYEFSKIDPKHDKCKSDQGTLNKHKNKTADDSDVSMQTNTLGSKHEITAAVINAAYFESTQTEDNGKTLLNSITPAVSTLTMSGRDVRERKFDYKNMRHEDSFEIPENSIQNLYSLNNEQGKDFFIKEHEMAERNTTCTTFNERSQAIDENNTNSKDYGCIAGLNLEKWKPFPEGNLNYYSNQYDTNKPICSELKCPTEITKTSDNRAQVSCNNIIPDEDVKRSIGGSQLKSSFCDCNSEVSFGSHSVTLEKYKQYLSKNNSMSCSLYVDNPNVPVSNEQYKKQINNVITCNHNHQNCNFEESVPFDCSVSMNTRFTSNSGTCTSNSQITTKVLTMPENCTNDLVEYKLCLNTASSKVEDSNKRQSAEVLEKVPAELQDHTVPQQGNHVPGHSRNTCTIDLLTIIFLQLILLRSLMVYFIDSQHPVFNTVLPKLFNLYQQQGFEEIRHIWARQLNNRHTDNIDFYGRDRDILIPPFSGIEHVCRTLQLSEQNSSVPAADGLTNGFLRICSHVELSRPPGRRLNSYVLQQLIVSAFRERSQNNTDHGNLNLQAEPPPVIIANMSHEAFNIMNIDNFIERINIGPYQYIVGGFTSLFNRHYTARLFYYDEGHFRVFTYDNEVGLLDTPYGLGELSLIFLFRVE